MKKTTITLITFFTFIAFFLAAADDRERREQRDQAEQRRGGDRDDRREVDWDSIKSRIEAGVKSGRITRDQADRLYDGLRRRMGGEAASRDRESSQKRPGDIVDVAAGNKSFRTLVAAVKAAGLVDTLKGKGPFTVFAPTDEAFSKLPKGTLESLLKPENKKKLVSILTYHVVPGKVLAKDVRTGRVKTANGSSLDVRVSRGGVTVNKAKVVATDVMASNGVIHVIDTVIIPPSRDSQASDRRKEWEERIRRWREMRERGRDDDDRDNRDWDRRGREDDRGEQMRRALGEWIERMRERGRDDDDRGRRDWDRRGRGDDRGEQMRREWEERMKKAREDRERAERSSRDRGDDRGEQMRREWEERMKRWREMRERGSRSGWQKRR